MSRARELALLAVRTTASPTGAVAACWVIASIFLGFLAWRTGVSQLTAAGAVGLAAAPGLATIVLAAGRRWAHPWTAYVWIAFATSGASASGGFGSPMAAAFALAPAFARTGREAAEAAFFAALGYLAAGVVARIGPPPPATGVLPTLGAGLSLLAVGALIAVRGRAARAGGWAPRDRRAPRALEERLAAQRRRVAELAHELRTPLGHIVGFADVMRQQLFGPLHERYVEYVELIHSSGQDLLDLANRMLDLARIEAGRYELQRERFDMALIAEEVARRSAQSARSKTITLTNDTPVAPLLVNADARAMRQILTNLVANAIKFTPQGGRVGISVYAHEGRLRLEVEDSGPGIPPEERARLGAAFERGASGAAAEGYGLGLSLVRAFAELHGGRVSFHDAPGGGALVRVEAPVLA
jgi:signal transduction histidine kinase